VDGLTLAALAWRHLSIPTAFATLCALALASTANPAIGSDARTSEAAIAADGCIAFVQIDEQGADIFLAGPGGYRPYSDSRPCNKSKLPGYSGKSPR
jgi:hypothetical protein